MEEKKVVLVGVGYVLQMIKYYLSGLRGIKVVETDPATMEDLISFIQQAQPSTVIIEQSPATNGYIELLLKFSREANYKVVEVNPHSNTIQVAQWNQVQLERMQDFLAVL